MPSARDGWCQEKCRVDISKQAPSKQWAALKCGGEKIAEVWFKPDGEACALTFRIPRETFQISSMDELLSMGNLLKAVAIPTEEVESWHHGISYYAGKDGANPALREPLPPPPPEVAHLMVHVRLKPPSQVVAANESAESESPSRRCQDLEDRWGIILGVEATIDTFRQTMEGLQIELQPALHKPLTLEEIIHALNRDVAQWNKETSRAHFALPKVRDFIHRATWALGTPERKALAEFFKEEVPPDTSLPEMNKLADQVENLLKDRQVLLARGT